MQIELQMLSVKEGHSTRKFSTKDRGDFDDVVNVIHEKVREGWILYGKDEDGSLKILLQGAVTEKNDVKDALKKKDNTTMMLDSPANSDEESVWYEKVVLAAPIAGG